jgi:hypothetical protein
VHTFQRESAKVSRDVRSDDTSGCVCHPEAPLVVVEPMRVAGNASELQHPLRLPCSRREELKGVAAQRIALAERQKPGRVRCDAQVMSRAN